MKQLILSSFRQRQRRPGFYFGLIAFLVLPVFFTPQADAPFKVMLIEKDIFDQADNPSWLPLASAIIFGTFLVFFGFSFIQNANRVDQESGIWDWLFTSRFSRLKYVFSKFGANILLLLSLLGATILGTILMILLRFPSQGINLWTFFSAFLMLFPGIVLIAALAIFLEMLVSRYSPWLLSISTLGVVALWSFQDAYPTTWWTRLTNVGGISYALETIRRSVQAAIGRSTSAISFFSEYVGNNGKPSLKILPVYFSAQTIILIFGEILLAGVIVLISAGLVRNSMSVRTKKTKRRSHKKVQTLPTVSTSDYTSVGGKTPILSTQVVLLEMKRQMSSVRNVNLVLIFLVWIGLWIGSAESQQYFLYPMISILSLAFLTHLGIDQNGFSSWLKTIRRGYWLQKVSEICVGSLISVVLVLPVMTKNSEAALQILLFSLAQVCLAEGLATCFNNSRLITSLLTIVWLLYLNGITFFLDFGHFNITLVLIYSVIIIIGLLLTLNRKVSKLSR